LTPAHPAPPPPRSYGTIKFATTAAADAAIEGHNGTDLEGRTLTVKLDRFA
jgi:RNA recognition motif-containing protein